MNKTIYVISYDVSSDKLRTKIAKTLEDYGIRVQYSVFECKLTEKKFKELYASLISLIEEMKSEEISIRIYPLCETCRKKQLILGTSDKKISDSEVIVI